MGRFLVVDDNPTQSSGLARLLTMDGHDVKAFTAGVDAVEALSKFGFDVVLTDLDMPEVDGHAVLRTCRDKQPQACLVVVSGRAAQMQSALAESGACLISDKPLDYDAVLRAISDCRARQGSSTPHVCHVRMNGLPQLITFVKG